MKSVDNRQSLILNILSEDERIGIQDLSKRTGVSLVTLRKDLVSLENRRLIRWEKGIVAINNRLPFGKEMVRNYSARRRIARSAATLVHPGQTIFLGGGMCCIHLAEELITQNQPVTILTNSVYLCTYVGMESATRVFLTGGDYDPTDSSLYGNKSCETIKDFHAEYFFSQIDGYKIGTGYLASSLERQQLFKEMAEHSDETIILAEHELLFPNDATYLMYPPEYPSLLITDRMPPDFVYAELREHRSRVLTV